MVAGEDCICGPRLASATVTPCHSSTVQPWPSLPGRRAVTCVDVQSPAAGSGYTMMGEALEPTRGRSTTMPRRPKSVPLNTSTDAWVGSSIDTEGVPSTMSATSSRSPPSAARSAAIPSRIEMLVITGARNSMQLEEHAAAWGTTFWSEYEAGSNWGAGVTSEAGNGVGEACSMRGRDGAATRTGAAAAGRPAGAAAATATGAAAASMRRVELVDAAGEAATDGVADTDAAAAGEADADAATAGEGEGEADAAAAGEEDGDAAAGVGDGVGVGLEPPSEDSVSPSPDWISTVTAFSLPTPAGRAHTMVACDSSRLHPGSSAWLVGSVKDWITQS
mmetsp:Transcript_16565/g.62667  ORF Transcript_16565/g.62667 Transcript_16565/m.62667 type:complete len:334 (-) Transcript_16565:1785-2786(-)